MDVSMVEQLEETLFTTTQPDPSISQCCVIAFQPRYAVSFQHGPHSLFEVGEVVILYSVKHPQKKYESIVNAICKLNDVVIFELRDRQFENFATELGTMSRCQRYLQLGVNEVREPSWKDGLISEAHITFFIGTTHGRRGDSGSGVFDEKGRFLGIAVAKKDFKFEDRKMLSLGEVADHHPVTKIICITTISGVIVTNPKKFEPPPKKIKC